jgi:hypothetical protein
LWGLFIVPETLLSTREVKMKKKSSWEVEKESKEYLEILEIQQGVTD